MSNTVQLKLAGKEYRVACGPAEREALLAAVSVLDSRLQKAGEKTKGGSERAAIMTALNLAHELLTLKDTPENVAATLESGLLQQRINSIAARIDETLAQHEQLF